VTLADIDLRTQVTDLVHFQGNRPLCVAFAMSLLHESERTRAGEEVASLAPEALWANALRRGLTSKDGTSTAAIADALEDEGQPSLADWPFNGGLAELTEVAPAIVGAPPWLRAGARHFRLARDRVEAELEAVLAAGQLALIVVDVTNEFYFPLASGVVDTDPGSASLGRHAIACVGAATVAGERLFLVQNSWGDRWGAGGYGWLNHDYLSVFGGEAAALTALL
jgi:hypothetical protein